jgi:hypothetical protein
MNIKEAGSEDVNSLRIKNNGILWVHWLALLIFKYSSLQFWSRD